VSVLEALIASLKEFWSGLPDRCRGPLRDGQYATTDIGLVGFSVLCMGSPTFLAHQRALAEGHERSNRQTLFAMSAIPTAAPDTASPRTRGPSRLTQCSRVGTICLARRRMRPSGRP